LTDVRIRRRIASTCINEYVPIELMWREKEALSFHKIKP
jgi:hypothetical protein